MKNLTHLDREGRVRMVDVTAKAQTDRTAVAQGWVTMAPATFHMIRQQGLKKGNVLETARIAGIMAAKKTADLIPMCHPLNITHSQIDFFPDEPGSRIRIEASVRILGPTGVEMEALTAVALAALTIYDMCKAVDREMTISDICVLKKSGGKSGDFTRDGSH
ncbi:MAG: cyclic pyranopterin monophosphate synthase MoaC [Desulfobacteraceae bacterium]|jgi:cyclic pyranopterin phosphate synthase|nr:cyclic pyranopterin monophosphate synthase MoaC [Desulfobacteraceae bacterium]